MSRFVTRFAMTRAFTFSRVTCAFLTTTTIALLCALLAGAGYSTEPAASSSAPPFDHDLQQWNELGLSYSRSGRSQEAEQAWIQVMELARERNLPRWAAHAHGNVASLYRTLGQLAAARSSLEVALAIYSRLDDHQGKVSALNGLGLLHLAKGESDQAAERFNQAYELAEAVGALQGLADSSSNLGLVARRRGDLAQAEQLFQRSRSINTRLKRLSALAADHTNLGNVRLDNEDKVAAKHFYVDALSLYEQLKSKPGLADSYTNLGNVLEAQNETQRAESMYRRGLTLYEEMGRRTKLAKVYMNLGRIYRNDCVLDASRNKFLIALNIFEELDDTSGMADIYLRLGVLFESHGIALEAERYYYKTLEIEERLQRRSIVLAYNSLAWLYATSPDDNVRNSTRAADFAEKALEIEERAMYLDTLAAALADQGAWHEAIQLQQRALGGRVSGDRDVIEMEQRLDAYKRKQSWTEYGRCAGV